jgi:hypothetical protein
LRRPISKEPKTFSEYRKKAIYGSLRREMGRSFRELCAQHVVELPEGQGIADLTGRSPR